MVTKEIINIRIRDREEKMSTLLMTESRKENKNKNSVFEVTIFYILLYICLLRLSKINDSKMIVVIVIELHEAHAPYHRFHKPSLLGGELSSDNERFRLVEFDVSWIVGNMLGGRATRYNRGNNALSNA